MKKLVANVFVALAALAMLTGCGTEKNTEAKKGGQLRVACFPNITHAQALLMKNQKMLEEKLPDYEVSWKTFTAGSSEIEAIFAGEIDMGYIGPVPAINGNVKSNGEVTVIANAADAGAVLVKGADTDISSVEDLAGKTVAIPQIGNTQHLCLLSILSEQGLKTVDAGGDVTVNASSNADILNLIDNGSVDAALVPEPWGTTIENNGNAEILLDHKEVFLEGDYPTAVVVASQDFIEDHPDLVREFLEAHEEATVYINENMDEARSIVNTEIKETTGKALDEEVIKNAFTRMTVDTQLNREAIMKFAEISKTEGFISKVPEEDDVFTTEFNK